MMAVREPFPTDLTEFKDDERISYDTVSGSYKLEDEKSEEWEWMPKPEKWVPVVRNSQNPVLAKDRPFWPAYPVTVT